jgi:hypothetical protein
MDTASRSRGVITLAYGHARFLEQAKSLAHSLQVHAPQLPRTLVTDSSNPELRKLFTEVIPYKLEYGSGVRQKLYLDHYSPYDETLFIDSDCLALGNLDDFWTAFEGQYFGVPGFKYLYKGAKDQYLDVDLVLDKHHLESIPKFNGGTYYFTKSPQADAFFAAARNTLDNWRELGLREFRGNGPNDEAVYAVAMAIHGVRLTSMGPRGMWTPTGYRGPLLLDAIAGTCSFEKEGNMLSPEVIHFPGEYCYSYAYARERRRLLRQVEGKRTPLTTTAKAYVTSMLWQGSRKLSALSKLGRMTVRFYRSAAR